MFAIPKPETNGLQEVIDALTARMLDENPTTKEYSSMVAHLDKLTNIKDKNTKKRVSPDTWVASGVNLAGILFIIKHEQFNVIASKALGFVAKMR